jgi:hypothetical protein
MYCPSFIIYQVRFSHRRPEAIRLICYHFIDVHKTIVMIRSISPVFPNVKSSHDRIDGIVVFDQLHLKNSQLQYHVENSMILT